FRRFRLACLRSAPGADPTCSQIARRGLTAHVAADDRLDRRPGRSRPQNTMPTAFARSRVAPDIKPDDCVEVRIVFFDAGEEMLQRLSGAHLAFANEPGDLDCRFEVKLIHGLRPISRGIAAGLTVAVALTLGSEVVGPRLGSGGWPLGPVSPAKVD